MAEVVWTNRALRDLEAIHDQIAADKPQAAAAFAVRLYDAGMGLGLFPTRGRVAPAGTRELAIVRPYLIRYDYDLERDRVLILRIWHGARDTP